jgi:hypothetical protein
VSMKPALYSWTVIALLGLCSLARADEGSWFCSVADPTTSKPQIVVYKIVNGNLIVNDWRNRLSNSKNEGDVLQILENNSQGIIAIRAKGPAETRSTISTRVVLIDRAMGQVRDIAASINGPIDEIQGSCLPGN